MSNKLGDTDFSNGLLIAGMAGLLHDCGHVAFSHVGEHILEDVLRSDFDEIRRIFAAALDGPIQFYNSHGQPINAAPHPSELLSALFVVSEPMVELLNRQGVSIASNELVLTIAGIILGYAPRSLLFNRQYLHFLKDIISGDIDADKIDYVARDGYFAGVPLAVDVERLLSQLVALDIQQHSLPPSVRSELPTREVDAIYAIGLRPTGASAMEMLVLTRVYLFDRIYLHHKVKAAERLAESVLRSYLMMLVQDKILAQEPGADSDPANLRRMITNALGTSDGAGCVLTELMRPGGDDSLLAHIGEFGRQHRATAADIGTTAEDLLNRHLPRRALPIALRASVRAEVQGGDRTSQILWPNLKLALKDGKHRDRFEDRVIELCTDDPLLLFDYAQRKPVPEDPDIWVRTAPGAVAERLNRHFSVEQLSNAYKELKETGWIFCRRGGEPQAAAAAAVALYEQFGIVPNAHGLELAKIEAEAYDAALATFLRVGAIERSVADALSNREVPNHLLLQGFELREYLPKAWNDADRTVVARKLAGGLSNAKLPSHSSRELNAALPLLQLLLRHASQSHDDIRKWNQSDVAREKYFAGDLKLFLESNEVEATYRPFKEVVNQPGRIDLLFIHRNMLDMEIVVELKSELASFGQIVDAHAGQPMAYCTRAYARISILYAQFGGDSYRQCDAIEVRRLRPDETSGLDASALAVICIGHRGFGRLPSDSGQQSLVV